MSDRTVQRLLEQVSGASETQIVGDDPSVVTTEDRGISDLCLGVPLTVLPESGRAEVTIDTYRPFRPRRLVLSTNLPGGRFLVSDLRVGNISQFINARAATSLMWHPRAVGQRIRGNTMEPGVGMLLIINNPAPTEQDIRGAVFGAGVVGKGAVRRGDGVSGVQIVGSLPQVEDVPLGRTNELIAGLGNNALTPAVRTTINVPVNRPFRPRRLVLDLVGGGVLLVHDIRIGNISQLLNGDPLDGSAFAFDAVGVNLQGDTAQPGVGIDLDVSLTSGSPGLLFGGIVGEAAVPY